MNAGEETRKRGLGRGLSALFADAENETTEIDVTASRSDSGDKVRMTPIEKLIPGRYQPRRLFDASNLDDLILSVREKGVLQPLLVRPHPDQADCFEIIAGERRWRASQAAGLHEIPVILRNLSDREALEVALIENLQRQDLSPLEEAEGYRRLLEEFAHTQEELAKAVGKSRSHVANMMRLLALPEPVKKMLDGGELTAGHARALLSSPDPQTLARQVISKGLNVRQTEKLAQTGPGKGAGAGKKAASSGRDADIAALERDLTALLGLKVVIRPTGRGGEITIHYGTLEQLDDILHRLSSGAQGSVGTAPSPGEQA